MDKTEKLKDGTDITIRPLVTNDLDGLVTFYQELPLEDRKYLKFDVSNRNAVARRLRRVESGDDIRVLALLNGRIIASGALELSGEELWSKHQGEIRVVVARDFQQRGLGTLMIRELYFLAIQNNVEMIVARMMRPQIGALKIFRKLGFREATLLPDFVKDLEGVNQDMIVMTCSVKDLWKELDHLFSESDWQRCR
jgi:L-amino acid N-acyltransferase YncA